MVSIHLYVEGGGDSKLLHGECRQGFREFLQKAGLRGHLPRTVACGGRRQAYNAFCTALAQAKHTALLLVDSEEAVTVASPWQHLRVRQADQWPMPAGADDNSCHLMVQCMESWLIADRETLRHFFGNGFDEGKLPSKHTTLEAVAKFDIYRSLQEATERCKARYGKGENAFKLLARLDAAKVLEASIWATRFANTLKQKAGV